MDSGENWLINSLFAPIWILLIGIVLILAWHILHRISNEVGKYFVRNYLAAKGARLIQFYWAPTGPGWLGGRRPIYRVVYEDVDKNLHQAYCTTEPLAGVYFTDDEIVERGNVSVGQARDRRLQWDVFGRLWTIHTQIRL
jgi:hypothetical protein